VAAPRRFSPVPARGFAVQASGSSSGFFLWRGGRSAFGVITWPGFTVPTTPRARLRAFSDASSLISNGFSFFIETVPGA